MFRYIELKFDQINKNLQKFGQINKNFQKTVRNNKHEVTQVGRNQVLQLRQCRLFFETSNNKDIIWIIM